MEFWKKKFVLCATKKVNILTLVLSEKKIPNETKNHTPPPPFKLNGRSLSIPDDGYSRNVSYALKLLSAFLSEKCTNKKYVLAIN